MRKRFTIVYYDESNHLKFWYMGGSLYTTDKTKAKGFYSMEKAEKTLNSIRCSAFYSNQTIEII